MTRNSWYSLCMSKKTVKVARVPSQLRQLLVVGAGLSVVLAAVGGVLMKTTSYELTLSYLVKDSLASRGGGTVLAPASRVLADVQVRYLLVVILCLAAVYGALTLFRLRRRYERALQNQVWPLRWIYLGVTGLLTIELVGVLNGVNDVFTLKLMGVLVGLWALLGWLNERQNIGQNHSSKLTYLLGLGAHVLAALPIVGSLVGTTVYGMERLSWFVYAACAILLAGLILMAINQWKQLRGNGRWEDYLFTERNYLLIDIATKTLLAVVLIVGLKK